MNVLCYFRSNTVSMYQKSLLSNAATSALRLHQRLPNFQLNREFFALLLLEDSAHYLFYSLIFVYSHPITSILIYSLYFTRLYVIFFQHLGVVLVTESRQTTVDWVNICFSIVKLLNLFNFNSVKYFFLPFQDRTTL